MQPLQTVDQAREEIVKMELKDSLVKVQDLKVNCLFGDEPEIYITSDLGKQRISWDVAKKTFAKETGVHLGTLKEYSEDEDLVNRMIRYSLERRFNKTVRLIYSGYEIWEVFDKEYPWIDPVTAFDMAYGILSSSTSILGVGKTGWDSNLRFEVRFVTDISREPPKRKGDYSHAGVWMRCNGKVEASAFVHRMVCSNGAMRDYRKSVHTSRMKLEESIEKNVLAAIKDSRLFLDQFIDLDNKPVTNPSAFITYVGKARRYSDSTVRHLVEQLPTLPERPTAFDLVNMVTSQEHTPPGDDGSIFAWVGGDMTSEFNNHSCANCARPL